MGETAMECAVEGCENGAMYGANVCMDHKDTPVKYRSSQLYCSLPDKSRPNFENSEMGWNRNQVFKMITLGLAVVLVIALVFN